MLFKNGDTRKLGLFFGVREENTGERVPLWLELASVGVPQKSENLPTIHSTRQVGTVLSGAGRVQIDGKTYELDEQRSMALSLSCKFLVRNSKEYAVLSDRQDFLISPPSILCERYARQAVCFDNCSLFCQVALNMLTCAECIGILTFEKYLSKANGANVSLRSLTGVDLELCKTLRPYSTVQIVEVLLEMPAEKIYSWSHVKRILLLNYRGSAHWERVHDNYFVASMLIFKKVQ
jgi:hypothetical protein